MKTCSICSNKYYAKGYCQKHYDSLKRHGNPTQVDYNISNGINKAGRKKGSNNQGLSEYQVNQFRLQLKEMRKRLGYNYTQMENILGYHKSLISKWERGVVVPSDDVNVILDMLKYAVKKLA